MAARASSSGQVRVGHWLKTCESAFTWHVVGMLGEALGHARADKPNERCRPWFEALKPRLMLQVQVVIEGLLSLWMNVLRGHRRRGEPVRLGQGPGSGYVSKKGPQELQTLRDCDWKLSAKSRVCEVPQTEKDHSSV